MSSIKNKIVIGIDQSYKDTGIAISFNGKLKNATDCFTENLKNNSEKRKTLQQKLLSIFSHYKYVALKYNADMVIIIERIRLQSQGFINIDYIKSIGALNALIVDLANEFELPVYSVDTRAWKSAVIGNSKGQDNKWGIDPKKYPTILWCVKHGYKDYIINYDVGKKKKGVITKGDISYTYNDNIADSIGISLYGFTSKQLLKSEH